MNLDMLSFLLVLVLMTMLPRLSILGLVITPDEGLLAKLGFAGEIDSGSPTGIDRQIPAKILNSLLTILEHLP